MFKPYKLIRIALLIICIYLQSLPSFAQSIAPNIKRILFLGNSITWAGNYVNDIEAYVKVQYPGRQLEFINVGLPSETVSGLSEPGHAGGRFPRPDLHERLARVLEQTKPDLVFACYGMNDGISMPFDKDRFQKFKEGINWLHDEVVKTGATLIHLTPTDYDEVKGNSKGYSAVLDHYADWILSMRSSSKWEVIDIHYPMKKYLEAHRKVDLKFGLDGFELAPDGVHPGETGHWIIARQILLYLGFKEVAKSPGIIESLQHVPNAERLVKLVTERQGMMRDAWLMATKHKRPGLPVGLPLSEAQKMSDELIHEISAVIQNKKIAEVYLIGGQSNATGQGYMANMADTMKINKRVMLFHSAPPGLNSGFPAYTWQPMHQASESPDRFGPELGFASRIMASSPGAQIAIIKHARSGTNLYSQWNPGNDEQDSLHYGSEFKEFMKTVNAGLDSLRARGYEPLIRGMIWQQGEAEAYSPDSISVQYGILLKHFIDRVREQMHAPGMAFLCGYVCPPPLTGSGIRTVRQAEHDIDEKSGMALSVTGAFVIQTDDLSQRANDKDTQYPQDHLHFGTDGTWVLGVRMALIMNDVLDKR
ncbi:MAG: sialate O-acetylesterase [Ginsengibacter sp.]